MTSCIICLLRVLSCTFTTHACCSVCLWFMTLILFCVVLSISLYISLYAAGFVAIVLYTMLLFTGNSVVQTYRTFSFREVGWTVWRQLHLYGIQPCIYTCTCIFHRLCPFRRRHLCSLCKRQNRHIHPTTIRPIHRATVCPIHRATRPTIIVIESCDDTIALGVECGQPK